MLLRINDKLLNFTILTSVWFTLKYSVEIILVSSGGDQSDLLGMQ